MRYGVNLYRERQARTERLRRGLLRGFGLGIVVGIEVLLIGLLAVTGLQFRERARGLEDTVRELEARAVSEAGTPDPAEARALVEARVARVDWSTVLEAVAAETPDHVILSEIHGGTGRGRGALAGMNLVGRSTRRSNDLSAVISYVEALRGNEVLTRYFPSIDLGTAKGRTRQSFEIVCRPAAEEGS